MKPAASYMLAFCVGNSFGDIEMKKVFSACILSLISACNSMHSIVGTTMPPFPEHTKFGGGSCIGLMKANSSCSYSLNILNDENDKPILIWVGKAKDSDNKNKPTWEVTDTTPSLNISDKYFIEYGTCGPDGKTDDSIVTFVPAYTKNDPEMIQATGPTYKVDLTSGKLNKIDSSNILCINTTIGSD